MRTLIAIVALVLSAFPAMSQNENGGIGDCWNRGNLSSVASRMTVTVVVIFEKSGFLDKSSISLVGYSDGDGGAAAQAFQAARRAILMCEKSGYPEKYFGTVFFEFGPGGIRRVPAPDTTI